MPDNELSYLLTIKDEATATIEKFTGQAKKTSDFLSSSFKNATIVSAAAFAGLTAEVVTAVSAYAEAEQVMAQTNAVIKSTKGVAGMTADAVGNLAVELMSMSGVSDEAIQKGENMLLTFTNIGKDVFPLATKTMLDMSTAMGTDLQGSAIQLGKALQDPIKGIGALRRVGVNFTDAQQDVIKGLVDSGKLMEAQKMILKELQTEFGGSAEAAGNTFAGKLNILKETIGNVQEKIGELIAKALTPVITNVQTFIGNLEGLIAGTESTSTMVQRMTEDFGTFGTTIGNIIAFFITNKDAVIALAGAIGGVLAIAIGGATVAMMSFIGVSLPVLGIFAAIGAGVALLIANWGQIQPALQPVIDFLVMVFTTIKTHVMEFIEANMPLFTSAWQSIVTIIGAALTVIKSLWDSTWPYLRVVFENVWQIMKGFLQIVWGAIQMIITVGLATFTGNWKGALEGIKTAWQDIWTGIKNFFGGIWDSILGILKQKLNDFMGTINKAIDGINTLTKGNLPHLPGFEVGGFVPRNMVAQLHQGEFVLSKDMLSGNQAIPNSITNSVSNSNQVVVNATINSDLDASTLGLILGQQLAYANSY